MPLSEHVIQDYASTSLSLKAHPVSFVREKLQQLRITTAKDLVTINNGDMVRVAGLVLVRQRPETAKGVCFMTIEDETGFANLVVFPNIFEEFRKPILQSKLIVVEGTLQREEEVIHVIVSKCYNANKFLRKLTSTGNENLPILTLAYPDEVSIPAGQQRIIPEARNFK
jgi:error-prone DNA polymerase